MMLQFDYVEFANWLNSFEWWTFIVGGDAPEFKAIVEEILIEVRPSQENLKFIPVIGLCDGAVYLLRKSLISYRNIVDKLNRIGDNYPLDQNAETDVFAATTANSMLIAEFLRQRMPIEIDPGYMRKNRN